MKLPHLTGWAAAALGCIATAGAAALPADDASIRATVATVARHQLRPLADGDYTPVNSLAALRQARAPVGLAWNYPWGVTLFGTLRSSDVTGDQAAAEFVFEHGRAAARYYVFLEAERTKLGAPALKAFDNPLSLLMKLGSLDSCGAMGTELLEGVLRHRDLETPEQKVVLARIADWIVHRQDRMPDGTLWRSRDTDHEHTRTPGTVWQDDLYMACPFLVRWSAYTGDHRYRDDAAQQIVHQAALLQDKDGIWFHAYFVNEHQTSPVKWGRAMGWGVVANADVLSALPPNHPARPALLKILRRELEALKQLQAPSGMWHQVLNHPETWEETSCTAMFAFGYARAVNRGWIDRSNLEVARRAFAGIQGHVTEDGAVNETCAGTGIGVTQKFYEDRPRPPDDLHGRGVVQLAGAEILAASH